MVRVPVRMAMLDAVSVRVLVGVFLVFVGVVMLGTSEMTLLIGCFAGRTRS